MDYKADITLNERDSILDILNTEKNLVKVYATVMTESCSKGFRTLIKSLWNEAATGQADTFFMLTDTDNARVESASEEELGEVKEQFSHALRELS